MNPARSFFSKSTSQAGSLHLNTGKYYDHFVELNMNFNSNSTNVNPEFPANDTGCGCTFSYNGGAGAGTAAPCCDGSKPYEEGFNDKKRDAICCCESSRCYERPLVNKKPTDSCSADFKYVPEFNYPPPPCAPADSAPARGNNHQPQESSGCGCDTYQRGLTNKKPEQCSAEYKYVVPSVEPEAPCKKGDKSCCGALSCNEPDTYETIRNTDAQRYKGKGPDRSNFYADDNCGCQSSNNASGNNANEEEDKDWSEIRKLSYDKAEGGCSPRLARRVPSFYCENENYAEQGAVKSRQ